MSAKTVNTLILTGLLVLALGLRIVNIGQEDYGNRYYAAAARNMLTSPTNFFFGSFDSTGFVTVDKPPFGLWIQSLFILIFGFNTFSLMLPSIIAGTISVFLLYLIVRKTFGETAGLSAAFILAITPIFVALSRNNTMDALLIADLLFTVWLFQKGMESGKLGPFLLSAIFIGFGFNIKMVQAFVVLPALFTVFMIYHKTKPSRKIFHILLISAVLIAVSLFWAFVVELTPEDHRPYIGGSRSNSALELMRGYNGLDRIREHVIPSAPGRQNYFFETGNPGFFRLFNPLIGGQLGWFIPFAVMGTLLFLLSGHKKRTLDSRKKRDLLFWGSWFLVLYSYLSFNTGLFHTHYIAMLGPAVAALSGIAVAGCLKAVRSGTFLKWFPPGILLLSALCQWLLTRPFAEWNRPMNIIMIGASVFSAVLLLTFTFMKKWENRGWVPLALGLLALSLLPFSWSLTPILYGGDPGIPYARPDLADVKVSARYFLINYRDRSEYETLLAFLEEHRSGEKYLLGVESALPHGASLALFTEGDIMTVGGFTGIDPVLSPAEMADLVDNGTIRYFLITPRGAYMTDATVWVMNHGKIVLNREWKQDGQMIGSLLYDCRPGEEE